MASNLVPENLEIEISAALNNLNSPKKLSESNLLSLGLVTIYRQKDPSALPYQVLKAVLTDILDLLERENGDYADILRGRYWEGSSPANMIANGRPKQWSEKTFYNYQKKARQEFEALLWQKEQEALQEISASHSGVGPLPGGNPDRQRLPSLSSIRNAGKLSILAGFILLVVFVAWVQSAASRAAVQVPVLPLQATSAAIEAAVQATDAVPTEDPVCGAGQAERLPFDGSVAKFFRSQGVSSFSVEYAPGVLNNKVRSLFIDRSGLWIGYFATETNRTNGLGHYDRTSRKIASCNHVPFVAGQNINDIVADRNGVIWVSMEKNGLAAFDGQIWQHYTTDHGLPSNEIYGLTVDSENNLWAGTWEGVAKFDGRAWTVPYSVQNKTLFNNRVHNILFDSQGNIWVGHVEKGISKYIQADGTWVHLTAQPGSLGGNGVRSMVLQAATSSTPEAIWVATHDAGVSQYENGTWTNHQVENGLPSNEVHALAVDKYNRVWVATSAGVVYWDDQRWITYNKLNTFSIAFGIHCPDKSCSIDDDHVWTGTAQHGLTQSRLPLRASETPFDVNAVCFELKNKENICPALTQDGDTGGLSVTYPATIAPGETFQVSITITPRTGYELKEDRGDMLLNTDADDANLFGRWELIKVLGTVEQGEPFAFVDYDNLFTAPQLPEGTQQQTFTSTWRVWRHNRYVGPPIRLVFTVEKP